MSEYVPIAYLSGDPLLWSMLEHNTCSVTEAENGQYNVRAAGVTAKLEPVYNDDARISSWYLSVRVSGSPIAADYRIDDHGLVDYAMDRAKMRKRTSATTVMQLAMERLAKKEVRHE